MSSSSNNPNISLSEEAKGRMFILLPGAWSGDMWHCAAATALCQSETRDIIKSHPVTIIGMKENVVVENDVVKVSIDNSISQGKKTYNYFHSLGLAILFAKINKLEGKLQPHFSKNLLSGSGTYLDSIIDTYEIYFPIRDLCFSTIWEATPETEGASNVSTMALPPGEPFPASLSKKELVSPGTDTKEEIQEYSTQINPPYEFSPDAEVLTGPPPFFHLWTATTIVSQYLHDPKTRPARIRYLQARLGDIDKADAPWVKQAQELAGSLRSLAAAHGVDGKSGKKVLLFNYRCGETNKQHDANIDLLRSVSAAAGANFVVVPLIVNVPDEETELVKATGLPTLELYRRGVVYDKRYAAAFWALVANELQDVVFGLLGGRSGSMDIAAFMGVNACSWDEPVFGNKGKVYEEAYVKNQGPQLIRLLVQRAIMSVIYVDDGTKYPNRSKGGFNAYKRLNSEGLATWLARKPSDAHISPPLPKALVDTTKAGAKILESAMIRLEVPDLNVIAVGLREHVLTEFPTLHT